MGIYVKTEKGADSLDYLDRIKSLEDSVTKLQNKVMTLQKYEITFLSSNVIVDKSYLNCYQFGNVVMAEGAITTKILLPAYGGMVIAKGFPSPNTNKSAIYFQPASTDGDYASAISSIGYDGVLSLNARFKSISANLIAWLQFCYICK